jgi:outer membrane lipoprotein SlyB
MRVHRTLYIAIVVGLSACAHSGTGTVYSRSDALRPWTVRDATIVQVTEAVIDGRESAVGTLGGGFIGHAVGASVGQGTGAGIAGATGAVAGAIVGRKAEKVATQKKAWEILVQVSESKETLAIVQPAEQVFDPGEKVRLYTRANGSARVVKL